MGPALPNTWETSYFNLAFCDCPRNDITAFSIFDTGTGKITSYYFDTRKPDSEVIEFDQFQLGRTSN